MPRPADALEAPRDAAGRLDLADQVDRPHVDAQLERGRRDHGRELALLQGLLGRPALVQAQAAVVRPGDGSADASGRRSRVRRTPASSFRWAVSRSTTRRLLAKTIVERCRLDQRRAAGRSIAGQTEPASRGPACSNGAITSRSSSLRWPVSTIVTGRGSNRARPSGSVDRAEAAEVAGHLVERPLGGREADADEAARVERLEPFQQEGEEDAALVRAEGVDLVDDHVRDRPQGLARPARQHQVQRFGRRDQDVGRLADEPLAVGGRGVAAPDGDRERAAAARPRPRRVARIPSSGTSRLREMSWFSAFSGEM